MLAPLSLTQEVVGSNTLFYNSFVTDYNEFAEFSESLSVKIPTLHFISVSVFCFYLILLGIFWIEWAEAALQS